jgi:hypothetical protein
MKKEFYLILALGFLGLGFLYYYLLRNPTIVQDALGWESLAISWEYSKYLNWLPSFAHQFAFSILTWLIFGCSYRLFSILSWMLINIGAEFAQGVSPNVAKNLSSSLEFYASRTTFAYEDIVAILAAAILAWFITSLRCQKN